MTILLPGRKIRVCIDAGHGASNRTPGRYDTGATHMEGGKVFEEAAIVLDYARILRETFAARGHAAFLTREATQHSMPLGMRARKAEDGNADLLISLHLNDFDDDAANGLEVLYLDEPDRALAQALQTALVALTGFKDRKIKQRELTVLKFARSAVLIELGFIANDQNRSVILNPSKKAAVCRTIAVTVENWWASRQ